jgi:hypothetical protein
MCPARHLEITGSLRPTSRDKGLFCSVFLLVKHHLTHTCMAAMSNGFAIGLPQFDGCEVRTENRRSPSSSGALASRTRRRRLDHEVSGERLNTRAVLDDELERSSDGEVDEVSVGRLSGPANEVLQGRGVPRRHGATQSDERERQDGRKGCTHDRKYGGEPPDQVMKTGSVHCIRVDP